MEDNDQIVEPRTVIDISTPVLSTDLDADDGQETTSTDRTRRNEWPADVFLILFPEEGYTIKDVHE
jgi:hypothetical protein